ncbi:MAG: restriction endonuclease [Chloroflexi bacterium]|nr:restriction endonuclease [Chloroflexota bacterium]
MNYEEQLSKAVQHFWRIRAKQTEQQGSSSGLKDQGNRRAVTGGKHLDGFIELLKGILTDAGLPSSSIHSKATTIPGYFRPTKNWDIIVIVDGHLLAIIELKSQVGSFGNNFNNRIEETLGNSLDILTAYREGLFKPAQKPWLGWFMLLEDSPTSNEPIKVAEPNFDVLPEFKNSSYAKRYELFCERLIRERLYDAACFLMSDNVKGLDGIYTEPHPELSFKYFATSLLSHSTAYVKMRDM